MNKLSIRSKLFIAIFLACALAVTSGAALFHFRTQQAFKEYRQTLDKNYLNSFAAELENFYHDNDSWEPLKNRRTWRQLQRVSNRQARQLSGSQERPPRDRGRPDRRSTQHASSRTILYDSNKEYVQGWRRAALSPELLYPLKQGDKVVGYLGLHKRQPSNNSEEDQRFFSALNKTLLLVGLLTLLSSFLIAFLLSRKLVKPIHSLRRSSNELASGNYATRIEVNSHDELGLLSHDFNRLAETLQEHEKSRRQWIMDIAHELRTPLSILRGEIEAIQDGISQADPQTIQSLHQETLHLQRLVEDLYTLSVSDGGSLTYHKTNLSLADLLRDTLAQFDTPLKEAQISLTTDIAATTPIEGDSQRLQQLFQNLLRNTLRYTNAPGQLHVTLITTPEQLTISFEDSAPGVPDESLPHLFERLYRVESSRNRATGGAGIGLSICHNVVQAHGGRITAESTPLGGLKIITTLPRSATQ
ncbi:MAG: Sensory histidine kinase BaeS [uncultured Thiotrichaceae bacterium]|uniref:histidine kinase n=1 Tax=uncultured Thiotrichaceae bacterium TaxID=298394 RepID=A0A6S6U4C1_9GAMM|nr:MAG: Sensory histidine kinase BaeS [uncultured Thiotrichaceae bacterium]